MEEQELIDILENLYGRTGLPRRQRGPFVPLQAASLDDRTEPDSVRVKAGTACVEVTALAPDLFRVGMFLNGRPATYDSPAIAKSDWVGVEARVEEQNGSISLSTSAATAHIQLNPLRLSFADRTGRTFASDDDPGMGSYPESSDDPDADPLGPPVRVYKRREPGERYFACGERTGGLEKTGTRQLFWNIDPLPGHSASHDNLYTSVPFTLVMNEGQAWGLFYDNPTLVEFDLARERDDQTWFGAYCGDLIYYVFTGPSPRDVLERYTELTGRTPMPPLWALGNHQSRYSYMNADELRAVANGFREHAIPCDALYLDIDALDGYRNFTFHPEQYPEPERLFAEMHEQGFKVVTIVDAGLKVDEHYPPYVEGRRRNLFCKAELGDDYQNVVWPGLSVFPDFTNPETREWWGEQHQPLVDVGIDGIWCDMNEPAMFVPSQSTMPGDVVHPGGGRTHQHVQVHNAYGMLMARAAREGLLRLRPDTRPLVISRAGYAGLQRHAMQWTGDNSSWWEHLWMTMPQLANMGLSGVAWAGVDIGGFFGDTTGELLTRWYEIGIFQPYCRNHAAKGTRLQEPWTFGEPYTSIIREMVTLRQRLLPYLYTVFEECHRTGAPILRPLLFEYPEDETTYTTDDEVMLGHALLIAPITRHGIEHRHVYLPEGTWFHWWTGERIDGPAHILAHAPLGQPPIYARADTPFPLWPAMQHTGETRPDPLTFAIYPGGGEGSFTLYEDAGDGFEHERGIYARRTITCRSSSGRIEVEIGEREGNYEPDRSTIHINPRGISSPASVDVDGASVDVTDDDEGITIAIPEGPAQRIITITTR